MAKWEHVATTIFIFNSGQVLALPLLGINIVFCIWLTNCVSKIEKSGVGWSDCTNIDVRDARTCILYMVLVAGVLLLTSDKSLVAVVGLALIVLVLGLRAGFHFYQFRTQRTIGSIIFVLTSMLFIETITWAFWSRWGGGMVMHPSLMNRWVLSKPISHKPIADLTWIPTFG